MSKTPEEIAAEEAAKAEKKSASKDSANKIPAGHMVLSEAEFNRTQAELRKLKAEREAREAEATRIAAEASGEYQKALAAEQERRLKAESAANALAVKDAIRTEILRRGLTGEHAAAALRLADTSSIAAEGGVVTDPAAADKAVETVLVNFKSLFGVKDDDAGDTADAQNAAGKEKAVAAKTPAAGPATPADKGRKPTGYLSPEEYMATPLEERMTDEFQKRVAISESQWPSEVPATSFSVDS